MTEEVKPVLKAHFAIPGRNCPRCGSPEYDILDACGYTFTKCMACGYTWDDA